jgi:hypothetical protein
MTEVAVPTLEQPALSQDTASPALQDAAPETVSDSPNTDAGVEQESTQTEAQETTEQREQRERGRFQRRLDRHKEARYRAEAEAKVLRERFAELEARVNQTQQPANSEPTRDQFEDYESFIEARAEWRAEKKTQELLDKRDKASQGREHTAQVDQQQQKVGQQWAEREKAFEASTKDYTSTVESFLEEDIGSFSKDARLALVESDVGPQLLYHLAKHPEVADKISSLSPVRQVAELGKLEAKLASKPAKTPSNAPPPASVTGSGRSANNGYRDNMSQSEFREWAKTQGMRPG